MAEMRDCVKALIDRLSDEEVRALWVILTSMIWPTAEITPEDTAEIEEGIAELEAGKRVKAEDVWRELRI